MNLTELLAPLPGPAPTGPDLSFSLDFDQIQELRRADDPTLPRGELDGEAKQADWPGVAAACEKLLASRTKDLRVAGWLGEAWARLRGAGGLADGLELYAGLCQAFWEDVHPQPEGGDQELRIGSISWVLSLVSTQARALPVVRQGTAAWSVAEIAAVRARGRTAEHDDEQAGAAMAALDKAMRAMPAEAWQQAVDGARRLATAVGTLQAVIDERLGDDGPAFVTARETARETAAAVERLAREAGALSTAGAEPGAAGADEGESEAAASTGAGAGGPPRTRQQALAQLRQVAEYFRRHEPHSPVAYLAERAARWGEMPLHQWLRHVLKEQSTLSQLEELLGIQPPDGDSR